MIRQQIKDVLFSLNRVAVMPNQYGLARLRFRKPPPEGWAVHLGCGETYIQGLINCDGNAMRKIDLWLDLRNRLPFPDGSCSLVYCSHTIEHMFPDAAIALLREVRRILRTGDGPSGGGVARFAVPSLEHALIIASGGAKMEFPRPFASPMGQAINYLFCDGQHKFAYCFEVFEAFAKQAGFTRVRNYSAERGVKPATYGKHTVGDEYEGSLVVELRA